MAIMAYTGLPGSGKSYSVTENVVLPAIKQNRVIYTNIPTNLEKIMQDYPDYNPDNFHQLDTEHFSQEIDPQTNEIKAITTFKTMPAGSLIIVDEIGTIFPASMRINSCDQEFLECWSKHRHKVRGGRSQDIVIIAQNLRQVSKFIRDLVDTTYIHFKLTALGTSNSFRRDTWSTGIDGYPAPNKKNPLYQKSELSNYKARIFEYYQSHTLAEDGTAPKNKKFNFKDSIFNTWFFKYVFPIAIAVLIFCGWFVYDNVINQSSTIEQQKAKLEKNKKILEKQQTPAEQQAQAPHQDNILVPSSLRGLSVPEEEQQQQYKDFFYAGSIMSSDLEKHTKYAILQRENGSIIFVNFYKYCKEDPHKHIECKYFGKDYKDTLR